MKELLATIDWANFFKGAMSLCFILSWGTLLTAHFVLTGILFVGVIVFGSLRKIYA